MFAVLAPTMLGFGLTSMAQPTAWRRAVAPHMQLFDLSSIDEKTKAAILAAEEAKEKEREEAKVAEAVAAWKQLDESLPELPRREAPVLTLYRDTNGWCPFCERVWVQLEAKGIPYREELINLQDKPQWYKDMVPTTLVPAVKFDDDESVIWESADVMAELERRFPAKPLLPAEGSEARQRTDALIEFCPTLLSHGVRMSYPNASATAEEREASRSNFLSKLDELDGMIAEGGGPFMSGDTFSLADAMFVPMLERWAVQLPLTTGDILLRPGALTGTPPTAADAPTPARWPAIERWFVAMEEELPAYSDKVMGDAFSWASLVGTFQRMFSSNATAASDDPERAAAAAASIRRSDYAARQTLNLLKAKQLDEFAQAHRVAAARAVLSNREAVIADALNTEPRTQTQLKRLDEEDRPLVEGTLREACRRLLGVDDHDDDYMEHAGDAAVVAEAARYVASRICAPRDMSAPAASALRCSLMGIAAQAEMYAWTASGGLL